MHTFHRRNHTTGLLEPVADPGTRPCTRRGCKLQMVPVWSTGEHRPASEYRSDGREYTRFDYLTRPRTAGIFACHFPQVLPEETIGSPYAHEAWLWECPEGHRATSIDGNAEMTRVPKATATSGRWGQPYWNGYERA